jgi:putative ABC transport system permease protein
MSNILGDIRFGFRMLKKSPGHTAAAVVALALGIGLTAAMFSIINGTIFTALPFDHGDRLIWLSATDVEKGRQQMSLTFADVLDWEKRQTSFSGTAAFDATTINLSGDEKPERFDGGYMAANSFDLLGAKPFLGRTFLPGEDEMQAPRVAILSYGLWKTRYGGDPKVVGRVIRVNGGATTVVGVMPEGFEFPINEKVWVPLRLDPKRTMRGSTVDDGVSVFARLKDGVPLSRAQAETATIAKSLAREFPVTNKGLALKVKPYIEQVINPQVTSLLFTMLGAVGLVLLLACANVASLMMARASLRSREIAIRSALGAGRRRVLTQILTESLLLSAVGAALGLVLAYWGIKAFNSAIVDTNPPYWFHIALTGRPLLFVLGLTLLSSLLSGLAPALQASKADVNEVLKDEGRGSTSLRMGRFSRSIVVAEVALSFFLLVLAGLMVRSVVNVQRMDFGFEKQNLLTVRLALYEAKYPEKADRIAFWDDLLRRMDGRPGVAAVAAMSTLPTNGSESDNYAVEGRPYPTNHDLPMAHDVSVSPGMFQVLGAKLLAGRDFGPQDREGSLPVVLVNESFAKKEWPKEDPLGRRIRLSKKPGAPWRTVVGVVPDLRMNGLNDTDSGPEGFYLPMAQECPLRNNLVVRTHGAPLAFTPTVRTEVTAIDPDLPLYFVYSMEETIAKNAFFFNLFGTLFGIFGISALVLAAVGIYGVISFSVTQRTQEIGVRMALGAHRGNVLGMIVRQGSLQLAIGLGIGLVIAFLGSRLLGDILFQIKPNDPLTFAGVCLALTAIALTACLIPAQRASRVDPLVSIRYE